ncbi:MAG: outer membrane protein assembly factor BamA [Proteobacteria bacterium]|nr:outer membrane protein assembly factor BamA [Pseudomonadota bacterium]MBU1709158.1 outer membrane protein assembly factor BamA [Pseudomonadota bacterium]
MVHIKIFCILFTIILSGSYLVHDAYAADSGTEEEETGESQPIAPSFTILFKGNKAIGNRKLREAAIDELIELEKSPDNKWLVDDAAFQMELAYRQRGFASATVDYEIAANNQKPQITFTVNEGPSIVVKNILFTGNTSFDAKKLFSLFANGNGRQMQSGKTSYVESNIQGGISRIRDFYLQEGYLNIKIDKPEYTFSDQRRLVTVTINIVEGLKSIITAVVFSGDIIEEANNSFPTISGAITGKPYTKRQKLFLKTRLEEFYGNLGYPDVEIGVRATTSEIPGGFILEANISSGPRVTIADITISGNEKTKSSFIANRLPLNPGDLYNFQKTQQAFNSLYQTGLFSKIDISLDKEPQNQRNLEVRVWEEPSKELYYELGWGSYELLRTGVGFREKNLFGTGRLFKTEANLSLKGSNLSVNVTDPWFFNTSIIADFPVSYRKREEPSFTSEEVEASIIFTKKFTSAFSLSLGESYRKTAITDIDEYSASEAMDSNYNILTNRIQTLFDDRNDLFYPSSGTRHFLTLENSDHSLGSDISFSRVTTGFRKFVKLGPSAVLAFRYKTGLILPGGGQTTIPLAERFFNGGENTVRSFMESSLGPQDISGEPVGGMGMNVINLEFRQHLKDNFSAVLFADFGNLSPNKSRSEQGQTGYNDRSELINDTLNDFFSDFRSAVGCGIHYLLPFGPARLEVAFNPDRDESRGERQYAAHFSIGMSF